VKMEGADMQSLVRSMVGRDVRSPGSVLAATIGIENQNEADSKVVSMLSQDRTVEPALQLSHLTYNDLDGVTRIDDINLKVMPGEIVGIAGVEGNGQTELGLILAGLLQQASGSISAGGKNLDGCSPEEITAAGVGIVPEDRHAVACIKEMSVEENLAARELMREFDVRASGPEIPMSGLSGGNQQKAVLARELTLDPLIFLLAAQPTRGLDVGAIEAVYSRIRAASESGLGVLLISSELEELIAVSDRIAVIYRGKLVGELSSDSFSRESIGAMMSGHEHV